MGKVGRSGKLDRVIAGSTKVRQTLQVYVLWSEGEGGGLGFKEDSPYVADHWIPYRLRHLQWRSNRLGEAVRCVCRP